MPPSNTRRADPDRRQRIIGAALEVIATHGVSGATHRRIAAAANVPLGSMTYHFEGMEDLLTAAFTQLAQVSSARFHAVLDAATTREEARAAVVAIIVGDVWATPSTLLLSYELYAFAARNPALTAVMQGWMDSSREALGRHFDPLTARALDAMVEGIGIHNSIDRAPLDRAQVEAIVARLAG